MKWKVDEDDGIGIDGRMKKVKEMTKIDEIDNIDN